MIRPLRRNINQDVIVANVFAYFLVLVAELATLRTGTPLLTTWHEIWGDYWSDYLGHLAPFGKLTAHLTARVSQHPIAVSGNTADQHARINPDRDRITVVPNGINFERITTTKPTASASSTQSDSSPTSASTCCSTPSIALRLQTPLPGSSTTAQSASHSKPTPRTSMLLNRSHLSQLS